MARIRLTDLAIQALKPTIDVPDPDHVPSNIVVHHQQITAESISKAKQVFFRV